MGIQATSDFSGFNFPIDGDVGGAEIAAQNPDSEYQGLYGRVWCGFLREKPRTGEGSMPSRRLFAATAERI
jgi:hypothetical protein